MTIEETRVLMEVIRIAYPGFYRGENKKRALELWAVMFHDDDTELVTAAVRGWIATDEKGFPPSIGQIKGMMRQLQGRGTMTEIEAWGLVKQAIRNSAYNAQQEYEQLPALIQEIITPQQLIDWSQDDISKESVTSSNFMRSFRAKQKEQEEIAKLPDSVKQVLQGATKALEESNTQHPTRSKIEL